VNAPESGECMLHVHNVPSPSQGSEEDDDDPTIATHFSPTRDANEFATQTATVIQLQITCQEHVNGMA
jgi:hypothetical protein